MSRKTNPSKAVRIKERKESLKYAVKLAALEPTLHNAHVLAWAKYKSRLLDVTTAFRSRTSLATLLAISGIGHIYHRHFR